MSLDADKPVIMLGGKESSAEKVKRLSVLLWGPAGIGKTTLAATMPGRKALINFDPDGPSSIANAPNVDVFDFSGEDDNFSARFKEREALGIRKTFPHYDSYIIDSLTTIAEKALGRGIAITKGAEVERPSPGAYMARNNLTITFVRNILQLTAQEDKHVCFIAHEGPPQTNDDGSIVGITMSLGGQLPSQAALRINECWPMFENSKKQKLIIVRKSRMRDPAKSRMFNVSNKSEFEWKFNPNNWDDESNMTLSNWWDEWNANDFRPLEI